MMMMRRFQYDDNNFILLPASVNCFCLSDFSGPGEEERQTPASKRTSSVVAEKEAE